MTSGRGRLVAAFDFDGTITRKDTLVPFLREFRGVPRFTAAFAAARRMPDRADVGRRTRRRCSGGCSPGCPPTS